jgi:hypothetical protein
VAENTQRHELQEKHLRSRMNTKIMQTHSMTACGLQQPLDHDSGFKSHSAGHCCFSKLRDSIRMFVVSHVLFSFFSC